MYGINDLFRSFNSFLAFKVLFTVRRLVEPLSRVREASTSCETELSNRCLLTIVYAWPRFMSRSVCVTTWKARRTFSSRSTGLHNLFIHNHRVYDDHIDTMKTQIWRPQECDDNNYDYTRTTTTMAVHKTNKTTRWRCPNAQYWLIQSK